VIHTVIHTLENPMTDAADTTAPATRGHVPADLPERLRHYVDGAFADSADGATFDVLDPVSNAT
jgi:5-carboxymethyl-2-hydroxymuconic-semialdehyde dehydrogenase